ncbi:unnamed protein product [Fusarium graminearum]|uniref:Chromosome 1, complete genome n=1 Tax=Gibberella zeae (strain ATCC MYA-4620 / CBS 123657 / FGSC 9075 / NRRL 31084 / PH-1) TaxID=229533 RepID=A0A098D3A3_GIBZE|nr:unnamed protein product [Fusarium graminearum]CZS76182.1 unnamed protein product [Fusarium graminearum]
MYYYVMCCRPGNGQSRLALWALWSRWQMAPDSFPRLASPQRSTQISRLYHSNQALVSTVCTACSGEWGPRSLNRPLLSLAGC